MAGGIGVFLHVRCWKLKQITTELRSWERSEGGNPFMGPPS